MYVMYPTDDRHFQILPTRGRTRMLTFSLMIVSVTVRVQPSVREIWKCQLSA
jgi:hypothetical protein